jgi:hypothetical protein
VHLDEAIGSKENTVPVHEIRIEHIIVIDKLWIGYISEVEVRVNASE